MIKQTYPLLLYTVLIYIVITIRKEITNIFSSILCLLTEVLD